MRGVLSALVLLFAATGCKRRPEAGGDAGGAGAEAAAQETDGKSSGELLDDPALADLAANAPPPPMPRYRSDSQDADVPPLPGAVAIEPVPPGTPAGDDVRVPPVPLPTDDPNGRPPMAAAVGTDTVAPASPADPADGRVQTLEGFAVRRFVLCKDVKDREPVEPTASFERSRDGKIWVFLEAANTGSGPRHLSVTFESADRRGAATPPVEIQVPPSPRYRTWAWATAWRPAGRYQAVVRDGSGAVVARGAFDVTE